MSCLDVTDRILFYNNQGQLEKTMRTNLGNNWLEKFKSFDFVPIAAASIGQVHKAVIELDGKSINVAVKVQYPGGNLICCTFLTDYNSCKKHSIGFILFSCNCENGWFIA